MGQPIDFVTIKRQLEMRGSIDKIGGLDFIFKLMDLVPSTE